MHLVSWGYSGCPVFVHSVMFLEGSSCISAVTLVFPFDDSMNVCHRDIWLTFQTAIEQATVFTSLSHSPAYVFCCTGLSLGLVSLPLSLKAHGRSWRFNAFWSFDIKTTSSLVSWLHEEINPLPVESWESQWGWVGWKEEGESEEPEVCCHWSKERKKERNNETTIGSSFLPTPQFIG